MKIDLLINKYKYMRTVMSKIIFAALLLIVNITSLHAEDLEAESAAPTLGDVPVDGGLSLLLAAGAVYGVRRVRSKKNV